MTNGAGRLAGVSRQLGVALLLAAAFVWTAATVASRVFADVQTLLLGVGLIATSTVATVGMVVSRGMWARRLGLVALAMTVAIAILTPIAPLWIAGLALTAMSAAALFNPGLEIRRLPAAAGAPPRAVIAPLLLVAAPFLYGIAPEGSEPWALLAAGLSAPFVAFAYSTVKPGGLIALRYGWPAVALGTAPLMEVLALATSVLLGVLVAGVARDDAVKAAFHPPSEPGTRYQIPPELSPAEILDAADIDESGRPR